MFYTPEFQVVSTEVTSAYSLRLVLVHPGYLRIPCMFVKLPVHPEAEHELPPCHKGSLLAIHPAQTALNWQSL